MKRTTKTAKTAKTATTCTHRWRIETPNGPTSTGICKRCGETREFRNYVETPAWEGRMRLGIYMSGHRPGMPREV